MIILSCKHSVSESFGTNASATEDYYLVTTESEEHTEQGYQPIKLAGTYCSSCYDYMKDSSDYEILEVELIEYQD